MSATAASTGRIAEASGAEAGGRAVQHGLPLGFLSLLPLFLAYEWVQRAVDAAPRNTAEAVLTLPLAPLGERLQLARIVVLCGLAVLCARAIFHAELGLLARAGRVVLEGFVAAVVLGPLLILLQRLLELPAPPLAADLPRAPALAEGLRHASGAAWEECLFRLCIQCGLAFLLREAARFFLGTERLARIGAAALSIVLTAIVFAALHLAPFVALVGEGGEPFEGGIFAWRAIAGLLLGLLFRLRGMGVAAWAHAFFNLALFVGAGPDVFL